MPLLINGQKALAGQLKKVVIKKCRIFYSNWGKNKKIILLCGVLQILKAVAFGQFP